MDAQMSSGAKLARTLSSLLRSSPQSLSTLAEEDNGEEKPPPRPLPSSTPLLLSLPFFLLLLLFLYLKKESFFSENLVLASAAISVASAIALRWKVLSLGRTARQSGSVQWFISDDDRIFRKGKR